MHQIKIFKGVENDLQAMTQEINAWLAQSKARVLNMYGNIAPQSYSESGRGLTKSEFPPSDVLLVFLYET